MVDGFRSFCCRTFLTYITVRYTLLKKCLCLELFWSTFFPHFPAFGLNTEIYSVLRISPHSARMRENAGKIRIRITPNTDTFYAVILSDISLSYHLLSYYINSEAATRRCS